MYAFMYIHKYKQITINGSRYIQIIAMKYLLRSKELQVCRERERDREETTGVHVISCIACESVGVRVWVDVYVCLCVSEARTLPGCNIKTRIAGVHE